MDLQKVPNTMADPFTSLFFLGRPLSPVYSLAMRIRSRLYLADVLTSERMPVPVISVGNLTMGGTGKTPFVRFISRFLVTHRFRPAIISRGYGGKAQSAVNVVSDKTAVLMDVKMAGDEPFLLAESLPGVPVLTGVKRSLPCRFAVEQFDCNVLILDDGFQHLPVFRDINLVLFNARKPLGNRWVFPGGKLREPTTALTRAHAFVLTGVYDTTRSQAEMFADYLHKHFSDKPCFFSSAVPSLIRDMDDIPITFDHFNESVHAFCGIANPIRFQETLKQCDIPISGFTALRDHQPYDQNLLTKISGLAKAAGARALITTEKDMVKLKALNSPLPIYSLILDMTIDSAFDDFLISRLRLCANHV